MHHRISRLDADGSVHHHRLDRGQLCSEPVRLGAGVVSSLIFDSFTQRSHLLLLSEETLTVQATLPMPQAIPITFHGGWMPGR